MKGGMTKWVKSQFHDITGNEDNRFKNTPDDFKKIKKNRSEILFRFTSGNTLYEDKPTG